MSGISAPKWRVEPSNRLLPHVIQLSDSLNTHMQGVSVHMRTVAVGLVPQLPCLRYSVAVL